jgi:cell wall-associated NlpC family hydrolase
VRFAAALSVTVCALALTACASTGAVPRPFPGAALPPQPAPQIVESPPSSIVDPAAASVVMKALELQGTPYRNGGTDPSGFDCSGLVQWVFRQFGVRLPREVRDQSLVGTLIDASHIQPGDLLFFETVSKGASHVGVAIGRGQFVHAPSSRGVVRVERYDAEYWAKRFLMARRVNASSSSTD